MTDKLERRRNPGMPTGPWWRWPMEERWPAEGRMPTGPAGKRLQRHLRRIDSMERVACWLLLGVAIVIFATWVWVEVGL